MTRDQKKALRQRRQEAERRQRERREDRLRAPLDCSNGEKMLAGLDRFFTEYPKTRDASTFPSVLSTVEQLNLLKLDAYKYAFSASIACVMKHHPDQVEGWRTSFPAVISTAEWLFKGFQEDWEVETPTDVEQAFAAYRLTQDDTWLDYLFEVVRKQGDLAEVVAAFLDLHSPSDPTLIPKFEQGLGIKLGVAPEVQDAQLKKLVEVLHLLPEYYKVAYVIRQEGRFVVGTHTETPLAGAPVLWDNVPVIVKAITPMEMDLVDKYRMDMEEV